MPLVDKLLAISRLATGTSRRHVSRTNRGKHCVAWNASRSPLTASRSAGANSSCGKGSGDLVSLAHSDGFHRDAHRSQCPWTLAVLRVVSLDLKDRDEPAWCRVSTQEPIRGRMGRGLVLLILLELHDSSARCGRPWAASGTSVAMAECSRPSSSCLAAVPLVRLARRCRLPRRWLLRVVTTSSAASLVAFFLVMQIGFDAVRALAPRAFFVWVIRVSHFFATKRVFGACCPICFRAIKSQTVIRIDRSRGPPSHHWESLLTATGKRTCRPVLCCLIPVIVIGFSGWPAGMATRKTITPVAILRPDEPASG